MERDVIPSLRLISNSIVLIENPSLQKLLDVSPWTRKPYRGFFDIYIIISIQWIRII